MPAMLICDVLWVLFWALWVVWALWMKKAERRESVSTHLLHTLLAAAGFLLMFSDIGAPWSWLYIRVLPRELWIESLGIAITLAGFVFSIWARIHLGRNWSSSVTAKVDHELIRTGPYRWLRHPIYTGLLLAMLGTAMVRAQVCGLLALALVYAAWKIKSRVEEHMMTITFGAEYSAYASGTGAMFPRVR
ncbi:MAG TPA: isoprenylcysteine carboxylmethyltransferase family protein [Candidatus Angelobacter sp.]|nr:isoprenylcysteine carboxylmethyltransferase family protein [Candidatus Angelobacter sp.]